MRRMHVFLLVLLLISLFPLTVAAEIPPIAVGTGMWLRFHHGPSTFALAPGASLGGLVEVVPNFSLEAKLSSGALFGIATGLSVSALFTPTVRAWRPAAGLSFQAMMGSNVFYYHAGTEYVDVLFPEWSAGVVIKPLRFSLGSFGISAFEMMMGTDLRAFGQVIVFDLDLFRVILFL